MYAGGESVWLVEVDGTGGVVTVVVAQTFEG